jgi:hypothetical protein
MRWAWLLLCVTFFGTPLVEAQGVTPPNDQFVGPDPNVVGLWEGKLGRFRFDAGGTFEATPVDPKMPRKGAWTTLVIPQPKGFYLRVPILCITWRSERALMGAFTTCRDYSTDPDTKTFVWGDDALHRVKP